MQNDATQIQKVSLVWMQKGVIERMKLFKGSEKKKNYGNALKLGNEKKKHSLQELKIGRNLKMSRSIKIFS